MKSVATIAFDYHPSTALAVAGACVALLAVAAIALSALAWPLRIVLEALAAFGGALALWRFLHPSLRRVAHGEAGWLLVTGGDAAEEPAVLHGQARIGPLHALQFARANGKRIQIVLTPDNLDADTRRRLTLILARADVLQAR